MKKKAFVLYKPAFKKKYSVIEQEGNRIDMYIFGSSFPPGSCISYAVDKQIRGIDVASTAELIALPFYLARSDILFVHHVIEICFQFIPVGSRVDHIFELLTCLYKVADDKPWSTKTKKIFVLQLLAMIGYYPEYELQKMAHLINQPFFSEYAIITDTDEREIDAWITRCISSHPRVEQFKTLQFLRGCEKYEN